MAVDKAPLFLYNGLDPQNCGETASPKGVFKMININATFDTVIGKIKPMHAVNNIPAMPRDTSTNWDGKMQAAHIPYARLHDAGGTFGGARFVDIPNVFPNFDADENDPASYDFAFTDALIERMVKSGVMPYYRLGVTIENNHYIKAYNIFPPKDFQKWARICEHIIMHYNEGWADGFQYNIEYWEIWNEADNMPDIKDNPMWKGTMEEYFDLYTIASKHLKTRFPHLKIGGYGSCGFYAMNNVDVSQIAHSSSRTDYFIEFFHKFLKHISENNAPMDFFSWHSYAGIKDNKTFANYPRQFLDEHGYKNCEIHLNEWNPGVAQKGTLRDAANVLAMMIALHDTPTDMMMYYNFFAHSNYCGAVNPLNMEPFKAYYAFYDFGKLYSLGKRVKCETPTGERVFAIAATDGNKKALVIVNHNNDKEICVNVSGFEEGATVTVTDENHTFDNIEANLSSLTLGANAIALIEA